MCLFHNLLIKLWKWSTCAVFHNWFMLRTYVGLLLLAYTWFWPCVRWRIRSFFSYDFFKFSYFSGSYNFILLKNVLLYIWFLIYLFVLVRDRFFIVYIWLKKPDFSTSHTNCLINIFPYLRALANLSVRKSAKTVMHIYVIFIILS